VNVFVELVTIVVVEFPPLAVAVELVVEIADVLAKKVVAVALEFGLVELLPTPCATTASCPTTSKTETAQTKSMAQVLGSRRRLRSDAPTGEIGVILSNQSRAGYTPG